MIARRFFYLNGYTSCYRLVADCLFGFILLANVFCLGAVGKMDLLTVGLLADSFVQ